MLSWGTRFTSKSRASALSRSRNLLGALALAGMAAMPVSAQTTSPNVDTADYVMSDFESPQLSTPIWGFWYTFTDRNSKTLDTAVTGNSYLTSFDSLGNVLYDTLGYPDRKTFPPGHTGDTLTHSLRFAYVLGDRRLGCGGTCTYAPYVGFGTGFTTKADTLDLSAAAGISFWAKADTAPLVVSISINTLDTTTGASDYSKLFTLTADWKLYTMELKASADFAQPSYSPKKPFNPARIKGMNFGINRDANLLHPTNAMYIDDLSIMKWKYIEPEIVPEPDPDGIRSSRMVILNNGFRVQRTGNALLVKLPDAYKGKTGSLEAIDLGGRVLARAPFNPQAGDVSLTLGRTANPGKIFFRVITAGSIR